jgi:sugar lactone lactonase YvrE
MHISPKKFLQGLLYTPPLLLLALAGCGGGGGGSAPAPVAVAAPAAPTGVSATDDPGCNAQVKITWTASTGATSYNVYRSTASGVAGTKVNPSTVTSSPYMDATVTAGTPYFYTVTAVNSGGASPISNEASVTPGAALICTSFGGNVQKALTLTPTVFTFAGTTGSVGATDAIGTAATFSAPAGIATDGTNLYVADAGNNKIRKIVIATAQVSTLAGSGTFNNPNGVTTTANGNVYVADTGNNAIRMITPTGAVTTIVTTGLNLPAGITTDNTNLYIANTGNNTIVEVPVSGGTPTILAGSGNVGALNGTGAAATFNSPHGITIKGTNLYVADTSNKSIRVITIGGGVVSTLTTTPLLTNPLGIATDGTNLYVTDTGNNTINTIPMLGGTVSVVAGLNTTTCGNVDGGKATASFCVPSGITTDGTSLYNIDTGKNTVRGIQ